MKIKMLTSDLSFTVSKPDIAFDREFGLQPISEEGRPFLISAAAFVDGERGADGFSGIRSAD